MNNLKFTKMHGLGNDFIVIDATQTPVSLSQKQVQFLCDRHWGIGCDQLLLVESASSPDIDFRYRIFNADGGEVAQCGNGARCFARFVFDAGLTDKKHIAVETDSGVIYPTLQDDGQVTVDMGQPRFEPADIPFKAEKHALSYTLPLAAGEQIEVSAVSMGNPHAVIVVEDVDTAPVLSHGPQIESHPLFPERCNAGFMQVVSPTEIRLRVFERGAGETSACGTGACAAVVAGISRGLLDNSVLVHLPGGDLHIEWQGAGQPVLMTGPAEKVFEGEIAWSIINSI
jgi:diaminopimelate epimerase